MTDPVISPDGKFMWIGEKWVPLPQSTAKDSPSKQSLAISDSVVMGDVVVIDNDSDAISEGFKKAIIEAEAEKNKKEKEKLDRQRLMDKMRKKEQRASKKKRLEKQKIVDKRRKIMALEKNDTMIAEYNSQMLQSLRERLNSKPFGRDQEHIVRQLSGIHSNNNNWCKVGELRNLVTNLPCKLFDYPSVRPIHNFYTVGQLREGLRDYSDFRGIWKHVGWVPVRHSDNYYRGKYRMIGKEGTDWTHPLFGLWYSFTTDVLPNENQVELQLLIDEAKAFDEIHSVSQYSLTTKLVILSIALFIVSLGFVTYFYA